MQQYLPSLPVVVAFLIAFVASASRILTASRAFWGRFPAWLQMLAPQIVLMLGAIGSGLAGGIKSWTDLTVVIVGASGLLLPGLPSNRSAATLQAGKTPKVEPSAQDVAVASVVAQKSESIPAPPKTPSIPMGPMGGALMALCLALSTLAGCAAFAAAVPIIAEIGTIIADAVNDLDYVEQIVATFPGLSGDQRSAIEVKLQAARLALQAAAAADNGASELTAAQLDASLTAFRVAWKDLSAALAEAGITAGAKLGATAGMVSIPSPLALRPVVK